MIIYLYNLYTNWPLNYPNGDSISVPFLAKSNSQTSENSLFRQIFLLSNIYLYFFWHKNLACKKLKRFLSIFFLLLFTLWTNVRLVSRYERYCHFCRKLYGGVKSGLWLWETAVEFRKTVRAEYCIVLEFLEREISGNVLTGTIKLHWIVSPFVLRGKGDK